MDLRNVLFILDFLGLVLLASPLLRRLPPLRTIVIMLLMFNQFSLLRHKPKWLICKQSLLIYKFECWCSLTYIGRTCQRLEVRIRQHVLRGIISKGRQTSGHSQAMDSAIGEHLLAINSCRNNYQDDCFSVLHRTRDKIQLNILEAIYIAIDHPSLCRQLSSHILNIFGEILENGVT